MNTQAPLNEAVAPTQVAPATAPSEYALMVQLEGFEGPLDLLLDLARQQKVDLAKISILALVDQYLAVIESARAVRLELAADWLVMAAWLAWLKSRLLLPEDIAPEPDAETLASLLTERLLELERMRAGAAWLNGRDVLGRDVFARGAPEDLTEEDRSGLAMDLPALYAAYVAGRKRAMARRPYALKPRKLWTVQDALARLSRLLGLSTDWATLQRFLPPDITDPVERRVAIASTLVATLETARGGAIEVQQETAFGPILLRQHRGTPPQPPPPQNPGPLPVPDHIPDSLQDSAPGSLPADAIDASANANPKARNAA